MTTGATEKSLIYGIYQIFMSPLWLQKQFWFGKYVRNRKSLIWVKKMHFSFWGGNSRSYSDTSLNAMLLCSLVRKISSKTSFQTAVRPAVQLLQIQEVHMWPHFNVQLTSCLHPVGTISALLHFHGSKQRPKERATLLLSSRSCFITRRRPWAPQ